MIKTIYFSDIGPTLILPLARLHLLHKTGWVDSTLGSLTGQYDGLHKQYVLYRHGLCNFKTGVVTIHQNKIPVLYSD